MVDDIDVAPGSGRVMSVLRAFRLLGCFEQGKSELTLREAVRLTGFSKTTAYRLLTTLEQAGWLERTADAAFRLTIKPFQIGSILVDSLELRRESGALMTQLATQFRDTVYLMVANGRDAICLDRVDGGEVVRIMALEVGGAQPLHLGAGPRVLLAFNEEELLPLLLARPLESPTSASFADPGRLRDELMQVRARGYATSQGDMTVEVGAVAAPVRDSSGEVVAAISLAGLVHRFEPSLCEQKAYAVVAVANALSQRLGCPG